MFPFSWVIQVLFHVKCTVCWGQPCNFHLRLIASQLFDVFFFAVGFPPLPPALPPLLNPTVQRDSKCLSQGGKGPRRRPPASDGDAAGEARGRGPGAGGRPRRPRRDRPAARRRGAAAPAAVPEPADPPRRPCRPGGAAAPARVCGWQSDFKPTFAA